MKIIRVERIKEDPNLASKPMWLVGFTDLVTLLLAFFILLYAVSKPREKPWNAATESLRMRFGGEKTMTPMLGNPGHAEADMTWLSDNTAPGLDLHYLYSLLQKQLSNVEILKDIVISRDQYSVLLSLPATTTFVSGDDQLTEQGQQIITQLIPILQRLPNKVEIVGHTDVNIINDQGRFGSNWHLSLARAYMVSQYLQSEGYNRTLLTTGRGTADNDLLPKNLPDQVRNELARRVDIRLLLTTP